VQGNQGVNLKLVSHAVYINKEPSILESPSCSHLTPHKCHSHNSAVAILARLRAGQLRVSIPAGLRDFSFPHNIQDGSAAHPTSYSVGTQVHSPGHKAAVKV